jgi:hypothetical protein
MRDAERLVEVEVTDVRTDVTRSAQSDLCIHVCAIHIDLTPVRMHDFANLADGSLEDAVR